MKPKVSYMERILSQLAAPSCGTPPDIGEFRFFAVGQTVMVSSKTTEGQWCRIDALHKTDDAIKTAELRAQHTAAALNEMYAGLAQHVARKRAAQ